MAIGGFPPRRTPPQKQPLPTVPLESIQHDDEGRRIITAPLEPAPARPAPTVALQTRLGSLPAKRQGPQPRPANMPQRVHPSPLTPFRAPPAPPVIGPAKYAQPIAFRNGLAIDVGPEDIPY